MGRTVSEYLRVERRAARALESLPWVRNATKAAYYRLNYLYFRNRGFRCAVDPRTPLLSTEEWLGIPVAPKKGVFFGYYDKSPWSPDMRSVLLHRVRADGRAEILMLDRQDCTCKTIAITSAWNHQQGSMAQWLPWDAGDSLIYNDCAGDLLVSRVLGPGGEQTIVPWPIQSVHPVKPIALSLNYRRLAHLRPEYGYSLDVTNFAPDEAPELDGLWRIDLRSGGRRLLYSIADLAAREPRPEMQSSQHKVNHAMYSPAGTRCAFLHRWLGARGRFSRLYVADTDTSELRLLMDDRMVSHYNWLGEDRLIVWGRASEAGDRYYLIDVVTGERQVLGEGILDDYGDGHPSFSPDQRWLVTDSYPDRARERRLLLYSLDRGERIDLARLYAPWKFDGAVRCDLHPRWSPDGRWLSIDSAHTGGRMSYFLNVGAICAGTTD